MNTTTSNEVTGVGATTSNSTPSQSMTDGHSVCNGVASLEEMMDTLAVDTADNIVKLAVHDASTGVVQTDERELEDGLLCPSYNRTITCTICLKDCPGKFAILMGDCTHEFCQNCFYMSDFSKGCMTCRTHISKVYTIIRIGDRLKIEDHPISKLIRDATARMFNAATVNPPPSTHQGVQQLPPPTQTRQVSRHGSGQHSYIGQRPILIPVSRVHRLASRGNGYPPIPMPRMQTSGDFSVNIQLGSMEERPSATNLSIDTGHSVAVSVQGGLGAHVVLETARHRVVEDNAPILRRLLEETIVSSRQRTLEDTLSTVLEAATTRRCPSEWNGPVWKRFRLD